MILTDREAKEVMTLLNRIMLSVRHDNRLYNSCRMVVSVFSNAERNGRRRFRALTKNGRR